jgi:hypothetical protein
MKYQEQVLYFQVQFNRTKLLEKNSEEVAMVLYSSFL